MKANQLQETLKYSEEMKSYGKKKDLALRNHLRELILTILLHNSTDNGEYKLIKGSEKDVEHHTIGG